MGWFDSFTGSGPDVDSSTSKSPSPLEKLDPQLRDFLQRESQSKKQQTREDSAKQQQLQQERHDPAQPTPDATSPAGTTTASATAVPPESLFPDGRYAHLWRTYRRQADVEEEAKTEHEKVADVVAAYEARKAGIARAALENCTLEQESWDRCARGSGWWDRSTGCVALQRRFQKCYDMNTVSRRCRNVRRTTEPRAWG